MELDNAFKERLRWALEFAGRNQSELAKAVGATPQAVQQWASGVTTNPRRDKLVKAAEFLGVRLEWLAYGRGPMRETNASPDREEMPGKVSEAMLLAREWGDQLVAALPEDQRAHWQQSCERPGYAHRQRLDWLSDAFAAQFGLYRDPYGIIPAARIRLWVLSICRELLPPMPGRKFALILAPLEHGLVVPERRTEALRQEARLLGIDVYHVNTPDQAAALLLGVSAPDQLPIEDDLGLDVSPVL